MEKRELQSILLWLGALLVVGWRVLALFHPHPAQTDPAAVRHAMAVMGLVFVACGLWAFQRAPGRLSRRFAWYGLTTGLHWGGPIGVGAAEWQVALLVLYFVASGSLAAALFLDVALTFDLGVESSGRARLRALGYLPPLVGGAVLLVGLATPTKAWLLGAVPLLVLLASLTSLLGAGVWFARWRRAMPRQRRALRLNGVVLAIVLGWLPYALASAGLNPWPGYDGLFNLPMVLVPAAVALAISARARAGSGP